MNEEDHVVIVTIAPKGCGDTAMEASIRAGAQGGTIVFGRGIGVHEKKKILGIPIEPEKEILLTVTPSHRAGAILDEIVRATRLDEPGRGIAFTLPIERLVGSGDALSED